MFLLLITAFYNIVLLAVKFIDDFIAKERIERSNRHAIIKLQTAMSQEEVSRFCFGVLSRLHFSAKRFCYWHVRSRSV